jgi:hypothetical protein
VVDTGDARVTARARTVLVVMLVTALVSGLPVVGGTATAQDAPPEAREVRTVWTGEFGVPRPAAVAFADDAGLVAVGGDGAGVRLAGEDAFDTFELEGADPLAVAVAPDGDMAVVTEDEVVEVPAEQLDDDELVGASTELPEELTAPVGATFDADGSLLVLDAATGDLVGVDAAGDGEPPRVVLPLDGARVQGIALNPQDGLFYTLDVDGEELLAFDADGKLHETYDTSGLDLLDPQELTFAPTSSTADDAAELNLFVADAGSDELSGGVTEVTLQQVTVAAVEDVTATLVQTIDTSRWVPASPDPSGVTYLPRTDRLTVVDSEVNEVTGAGYHGVNVWEVTRRGAVDRGWNTLSFTNEPTGVGHDPQTNTLFISTDAGTNGIHIVRAGGDGRFGTSDDTRSFLNTAVLGVGDTEDPEFDPSTGHLFFLDGISTRVYRVDPVDGVFGNGNDRVTSFDVGRHGVTDAEALAADQARGTLLVGNRPTRMIYEVTKTGDLVRRIDARVTGMRMLSGMTLAPASDDSGRINVWTVDRAVDNGADPNENDGKLFELSIPRDGDPPPANRAPVLSSVTIDQRSPRTNDTLSVTVVASDPDGDALTTSYQWRRNGTAIPGETASTLDLSRPGTGDKGDVISVRVEVSDGEASAVRTSGQVTIVNSPPVFDRDLGDRSDAEGASVQLSASATDADGDTLTYSAARLPQGVSIDAATGAIRGTIAAGAASGSPYATVVTAADGAASATDAFTWTVRRAADPGPGPEPGVGSIDAACPPGGVTPAGFSDVGSSEVHRRAIDCMNWHEVFFGFDDGTFRPRRPITRAQFASAVFRLVDRTDTVLPADGDGFDDVAAGSTHDAAIRALAAVDVINGFEDGSFRPHRSISRDQAASMLVRAHREVAGVDLPAGPDAFADDDGSVHEDAIDAAAQAGWILGRPSGGFEPRADIQRGQVASVLARVANTWVEDELLDLPG